MDDLALQIAGLDGVEVDQADGAYARSCKIERERRAEESERVRQIEWKAIVKIRNAWRWEKLAEMVLTNW